MVRAIIAITFFAACGTTQTRSAEIEGAPTAAYVNAAREDAAMKETERHACLFIRFDRPDGSGTTYVLDCSPERGEKKTKLVKSTEKRPEQTPRIDYSLF